MYKTKQDKLKAVRADCKERNATFKRSNHYINNVLAWHIESRTTGQTLASNMTIDSAYDVIESGDLYWDETLC